MDVDKLPSSRVCTGCKIDKPLEEFHKCKQSKRGRQSQCKECRNRQAKAARDITPEYDGPETSKVCAGCNVDKPLEEFHKRKAGKCGRSAQCKECVLKQSQVRRGAAIENDGPETSRICARCNVDEPFKEFYKCKGGKYGITSYCKECCSAKAADMFAI